jgi:hypothetical protein
MRFTILVNGIPFCFGGAREIVIYVIALVDRP